MGRTLSTGNLYNKKHKTFQFSGVWAEVMGNQETHGAWIIWGKEKNGKTAFALKLAEYISEFEKTLFVSGEEGHGHNFVAGCKRAGLADTNKNLQHCEYISIEELEERLIKKSDEKIKARRNAPKIVFIDNITIYKDELQGGLLRKLLKTHKTTLFVFLAHAERNEPYTAVAKLIKKLAKVIFYVEGMATTVSGRVPGGVLTIDEHSAKIFHGNNIEN